MTNSDKGETKREAVALLVNTKWRCFRIATSPKMLNTQRDHSGHTCLPWAFDWGRDSAFQGLRQGTLLPNWPKPITSAICALADCVPSLFSLSACCPIVALLTLSDSETFLRWGSLWAGHLSLVGTDNHGCSVEVSLHSHELPGIISQLSLPHPPVRNGTARLELLACPGEFQLPVRRL